MFTLSSDVPLSAAASRSRLQRHVARERGEPARPDSPGPASAGRRIPVGRQPITDRHGTPRAYEFLYRSPSSERVGVDRWVAAQQDVATGAVLHSVFTDRGVGVAAVGCPAFVNVTRSYLVGELALPPDPARLVLEVVESTPR